MNYLAENLMNTSTYIVSKIDNNSYCKTNGQFTRHLRQYNLTYREYYETYVTGITPICHCSKPLAFYQSNNSYAKSCGNPICAGKLISKTKQEWTDEQKKKDSLNKKIANSLRSIEQIKKQTEKTRHTFMQKYGVDWVSKTEWQKEKASQTKLKKYGIKTYNNREAISKTNLSKTIEEKNIINEKRRVTNLQRYGVENNLQKIELRTTAARKNSIGHNYTLPSGKTILIRGYENLALDILFSQNYAENQLHINIQNANTKIPVFTYTAVNRHIMKYYPDIYIPHENKIIEIKSEWWWNGNGNEKYTSRLENNLRKRAAVINLGYNYEVWIFKNKDIYRVITNESEI